jgi:flagellar basal-body rod modification protein FlgD
MDVTRSNIANSFQQPTVKQDASVALDRQQAEKNATASLQARYGEKMKEARPVKKALDKDDFMRIMITEMKHQDPTKPMDADRMATQMAQITSVEQLKNVSNSLDKLAEKSSTSDRLAMSMMIGKSVTVDKGRFSHQKGTISPVSFELPEAAEKVKLTVLDDRGEEVATRTLDPMQAGPNTYNWDGINASSIQSPSATYTVRIDAENKQGAKLKINPVARETIVGVTFEGGETNFLVGDPKSPQKVNLKNITRMEGDAQTKGIATQNKNMESEQAQALAKSTSDNTIHAKPANPNNGEFALPENVKAKLGLNNPEGEAALQASQTGLTAQSDEKAEGFPNGLKE